MPALSRRTAPARPSRANCFVRSTSFWASPGPPNDDEKNPAFDALLLRNTPRRDAPGIGRADAAVGSAAAERSRVGTQPRAAAALAREAHALAARNAAAAKADGGSQLRPGGFADGDQAGR